MKTRALEYPQWAAESYPDLDLQKWESRQKLGEMIGWMGVLVIAAIAMITHHFQDSIKVSEGRIWFFATASVAITVLIAGLLINIGEKKKEIFKLDWDRLRERLDIENHTSKNCAKEKAVQTLVRDAVWVILAELAKDAEEGLAQKKEMEADFIFFRNFGLVPTGPTPCRPNYLPLKPYFDAAEQQTTTILTSMLARKALQDRRLT